MDNQPYALVIFQSGETIKISNVAKVFVDKVKSITTITYVNEGESRRVTLYNDRIAGLDVRDFRAQVEWPDQKTDEV